MANNNSQPRTPALCQRIADVRTAKVGVRGKAEFARMLGLAPSTYIYYETGRVPPADVLVKIADLAGVDLRWLLTGEHSPCPPASGEDPVIRRAVELLSARPQAAQPLSAFLDLLVQSMNLPTAKEVTPMNRPAPQSPSPQADENLTPAATAGAQVACLDAPSSWIPVLGRTAAGVAQFWPSEQAGAGLTTLNDLIARYTSAPPASVTPAEASTEDAAGRVQLVTLPNPPGEVCEFVAAPGLKACFLDAFAVRVDGDSMAPEFEHGDLVVLSPSRPAVEAKAAVVQLAGQIGVTCKIFRCQDDSVHLVPVNERYAPSVHPVKDVCWALRVLARVRGA